LLRLSHLLQGVSDARITAGDGQVLIREVRDDSRLVQPGDLFVAVPGTKLDGRRFIDDAQAKGAAAILTEEGGASPDGTTALVIVPNARLALGVVAANRYQAAQALTLTAVTGTNGKTTTTYLIEAILTGSRPPPRRHRDRGYRFAGKTQEAPLTTPGALQLHSLFSQMKGAGCSDVVLEASSIALDQGRLHGCSFRVAGLSNITQDHLDYHGTMERYRAAKAILFRELLSSNGGIAVLFADDRDGLGMRREVRGPVLTLTRQPHGADVAVIERKLGADGTTVRLGTPSGPLALASPLVGEFNLANILLAAGMALAHGIDRNAIAAGISQVNGVPGPPATCDERGGRPVPGRLRAHARRIGAGARCVATTQHWSPSRGLRVWRRPRQEQAATHGPSRCRARRCGAHHLGQPAQRRPDRHP